MPLTKQSLQVNFSGGQQTKVDPWQVGSNDFLSLTNVVRNTLGRLTKRNGFGALASLPTSDYSCATTFRGNLTAVGQDLEAYSEESNSWVRKGSLPPVSLTALSTIRSATNQTQCDAAVALNGAVCTVYTDVNAGVSSYKFSINDAATGQNLLPPTTSTTLSADATYGTPRVFTLGNYFVIVYTSKVSSTYHLQYIAINSTTFAIGSAVDISTNYTPGSAVAFDGVVANNNLYLAWNGSDVGGAIRFTFLDSTLTLHGTSIIAGFSATMFSVAADVSGSTATIYMTFWSGSALFTMVLTQAGALTLAPVEILNSGTVTNVTSVADSGSVTIIFELSNTYGYDTTIATNLIKKIVVTPSSVMPTSVFLSGTNSITVSSGTGLTVGQYIVDNTTPSNIPAGTTISSVSGTTVGLSANTAGNSASSPGDTLAVATVSSAFPVARGVGLASKAVNWIPFYPLTGTTLFLSVYNSSYQSTYFLMDSAGNVRARFAYGNAGGYYTTGLPQLSFAGPTGISGNSVTVQGNTLYAAYLYKDLIASANKGTNLASGTPTAAIYSQTGVNLATLDLAPSKVFTAESGGDLHVTGGFLWMYDGNYPVEHGFHYYPSSVEASASLFSTTPTGNTTNGSKVISSVSSTSNVLVGMAISGTGIPTGATVVAFTSSTITLSAAATATGTGITLTIKSNIGAGTYFYQAAYEWTDASGNIHRSAPSIPVSVTASANETISVYVPTLRLTYKSNVKIVIYRWSSNQEVYYQVTSLTSPVLNSLTSDYITWVDVLSDSAILGNNIIYTNGGVAENIAAPASDALTLFDNRLWLIDSETEDLLWFSKPILDGTPVEMSDVFTYYAAPGGSTVTAAGMLNCARAMDDKLVLFRDYSIYYINGYGPDATGANSQYPPSPYFVTSAVGCSNQASIVLMPQGLMFQATDNAGIWILKRDLTTEYIGAPMEAYNSATVTSAVSVPGTTQIRFTLSTGIALMYDYYTEEWATFSNVSASASTIYNGLHAYISSKGGVFQETPGAYLDGSNPVLIGFQLPWWNLSDLQGYQRCYWFFLLGQYLTPHKLVVQIAYDYDAATYQQVIITPDNYASTWGSDSTWGSGAYWGGVSNVEQWQVNLQRQRCQAIQISVQEIYDPSHGVPAGAGLTLSGLELVYGALKNYPRRLPATRKTG